MGKLNIRIRFPSGQAVLKDLDSEADINTLISRSFKLMNIEEEKSECSQILSGFPPKPLDINKKDVSIESLGVKSGDTLIFKVIERSSISNVESKIIENGFVFGSTNSGTSQNGIESSQTNSNSTSQANSTSANNVSPANSISNNKMRHNDEDHVNKRLKPAVPVLKRVIVPADNSCLFTSINFCMCGEVVNSEHTQFMREIISTTVSADQIKYSEPFLGKPNEKYCSWIQTREAWGGAIEVQILADYFQVMIVVIDTQSVSMTKFGELGNYDQMMLLIYDGIHYDPLCQISPANKQIFPSADQSILEIARELGQSEKKKHNYTDTTGFTLKCLACGHRMTGQRDAQIHAEKTKHINFTEV